MADKKGYIEGEESTGREAEDRRPSGEMPKESAPASRQPESADGMTVTEKSPEDEGLPGEAGLEELEGAIEAELAQELLLEEKLAQTEAAHRKAEEAGDSKSNPVAEERDADRVKEPAESREADRREEIEMERKLAEGQTAASQVRIGGMEEERPGRSRAGRSRRKGADRGQGAAAAPDSRSRSGKEPGGEMPKRENTDGENSRKKGSAKKAGLIAACAFIAVLLAGGAIYAGLAQKYKKVFFPNTQINGLDASGKSVEDVEKMIASGIDGYILTLEERDGKTEQLTGETVGLHPEFDGNLEVILESQNPYAWLSYQLNPASYTIETMVAYDEDAFDEAVASLDCMDSNQMRQPENAAISEYITGQGYSVLPETEGTAIEEEALKNGIREAIMNLRETFSLEEGGVYKKPDVTQEDPALLDRLNQMNRYAGVTITYQFGDQTEVLNGERIHEWIVINEAGIVDLDSAQVAKYVEELAAAHNTSNKAKTLKTSYGPTIQIKGGTYGWRIDQQAEAGELAAAIKSGESQSREPVYSQKAASHGENDYGDTYVEINLTAQHLFFYKDGNLLTESDFVSGNLSRGWGTPAGTYPLTYKQRNAVLKGENYRTPVDYWMPFNGGIGMHDATWRSSFGGTIYKNGGSHGCINLPHSIAKKIYENISAGIPVLCYNLAGTEQGGSSSVTPPTQAPTEAPQPTQAPTEAPTMPPEQPPESQHQGPAGNPTEAPTEAPAETPQPTQPPIQTPETTAPAGPGSDTGGGGTGMGPGASA